MFINSSFIYFFFFFFFNDTATTEIYTLSLHDALPISFCPHPPHHQRCLDRPHTRTRYRCCCQTECRRRPYRQCSPHCSGRRSLATCPRRCSVDLPSRPRTALQSQDPPTPQSQSPRSRSCPHPPHHQRCLDRPHTRTRYRCCCQTECRRRPYRQCSPHCSGRRSLATCPRRCSVGLPSRPRTALQSQDPPTPQRQSPRSRSCPHPPHHRRCLDRPCTRTRCSRYCQTRCRRRPCRQCSPHCSGRRSRATCPRRCSVDLPSRPRTALQSQDPPTPQSQSVRSPTCPHPPHHQRCHARLCTRTHYWRYRQTGCRRRPYR